MEPGLQIALENGLVREFRLFQSLLRLTQEERQALRRGDVVRLMALAEHKENLLDRLAALEPARSRFQTALAAEAAGAPLDPTSLDHAALAQMDPDDRRRLTSLLEGVLALAAQVRDLVQGNRLLARRALNQAASQQAGLLNDSQLDLHALFTALLVQREIGARPNARASRDSTAHTPGMERSLLPGEDSPGLSVQNGESTWLSPENSLIEEMAHLHRQETAYRAVLEVSSRVLAVP